MFLQTGLHELQENIEDPNNSIFASIHFTVPYMIGFTKVNNSTSQTLAYEYKSILFTSPNWKKQEKGNPHQSEGGYSLHTISYKYSKTLVQNNNISIMPFLGFSLTYIPYNSGDLNALPLDTNSYNSFYFVGYADSVKEFNTNYHSRIISDFGFTVDLGIELRKQLKTPLYFSIIPTYNLGLINIYQVDGEYQDYYNNKTGGYKITSKGTFLGLAFKIGYRFPNNTKK